MTKITFALILLGVIVSAALITFSRNMTQTPSTPLSRQEADLTSLTLIDSDAAPFSLTKLTGNISVVNFIFTSCPDFCPRMTATTQQLAVTFQNAPKLQFISITVDPENDTPEKLRTYAHEHNIDTSEWHFLTGDRHTIQEVMRNVFHIGSALDPLAHSDRFVLLDENVNILGYYSFSDPTQMQQLPTDIAKVLSSK